MDIKIEKVLERDIDLLVINKIINDRKILNFFVEKVGLSNYELFSVEHSHMDLELGESDITIIVKKENKKIALLIENKIDAPAMDLQPERYIKRGNKGIESNLYDDFKVFIIAPKQYITSNIYAEKYPNKISYEELKEIMNDDEYAISLLDKAIEEKEKGYMVLENKMVTEFWKKYYAFIKNNYPKIKIHEVNGPRGSKASWPELITDYKQIKIIHKADRGYMDLTFSKMAENISIFNKYIDQKIINNYKVVETGKSLAIRIEVPCIDFKNKFEDYIEEMDICMKSATELYDLLSKINVLMMYNEI